MHGKLWEALTYPTQSILIICAKCDDLGEIALQITHKIFQKLCVLLYQFAKAAMTKCHKRGSLKQQKLIVLVVEPRSLKSSHRQGHALSSASRRRSFLACPFLFGAVAPDNPYWQQSNLCLQLPLLLCLHIPFSSLCTPMFKFPSFYKEVSHSGRRATP